MVKIGVHLLGRYRKFKTGVSLFGPPAGTVYNQVAPHSGGSGGWRACMQYTSLFIRISETLTTQKKKKKTITIRTRKASKHQQAKQQ